MLRSNRCLIYVEIYLIEKEDINEFISYLKVGEYFIKSIITNSSFKFLIV